MSKPTLSPHRREVLLDALRPPAGYQLDCAVGTCFSVNLESALLVPVAFALFDAEDEETDSNHGGIPDADRLLAAVRAYASQMTLYCERGRIAAAAKVSSVINYLDDETIQPVAPPSRGSFHPKLWVLRFASNADETPVHRVLCLSRNLTFDRSWDTIVRLEQAADSASDGNDDSDQTAPLIEFLGALRSLAPSKHADSLARSLREVTFAPPKGFDRLTFCPMVPGTDSDFLGSGDELFVASPFVSAGRLNDLRSDWGHVELASRADALDRLGPEQVRSLHKAYAFDGLESEESSRLVATTESQAETMGLSGLHAKVFSGQTDGQSFLLVGSANCTEAAFDRNYEFCVRLDADGKSAGPRALLRPRKDNAGLRALLQPYEPKDEPKEPTDQELELNRLEDLSREIAGVSLEAVSKRREDDSRDLTLRAKGKATLPTLKRDDRLRCWPVTLSEGQAVDASSSPEIAKWRISLVNVTGLISFELKSAMRGVPAVRFTLKAKLRGDLDGRLDAILDGILKDPRRLIRFLLLLLAAGTDDQYLGAIATHGPRNGRPPNGPPANLQIPLLEMLLRTFAREPGRLRAFERLLDQVESARQRDDESSDELSELLEVWRPVKSALAASRSSTSKGTESA